MLDGQSEEVGNLRVGPAEFGRVRAELVGDRERRLQVAGEAERRRALRPPVLLWDVADTGQMLLKAKK